MQSPTLFTLLLAICTTTNCLFAQATQADHGTLVTEKLSSVILRENLVGLNPDRTIKIYLPPGYSNSGKLYPVVYYFHNTYWSPEKMFEDGNLIKLLERSFKNGIASEFIFVAADYTTTTIGSLYENSAVSGRWLDFTVEEVVPFIDSRFRTLRHRNSRGLAGDFWGGRGALKLAMLHSKMFSVVYALHPVATGSGYVPIPFVDVDWKKIHQAQSLADLGAVGRTPLFVNICQAFLPNPARPPFYCDYFMEMENGEPKLHTENTKRGKREFLLEETLDESAANLRTMRGVAFDWGRFDPTPSHVYANQAFSRKLEDLGVEHEAEEYRGNPWNRNWIENGRFYTRVLPFFGRHLEFQNKNVH